MRKRENNQRARTVSTMATIRHTSQAGKNDPITSKEGAREQSASSSAARITRHLVKPSVALTGLSNIHLVFWIITEKAEEVSSMSLQCPLSYGRGYIQPGHSAPNVSEGTCGALS